MGNLESLAIEQMIREKEADMEAIATETVRSDQTWWFVTGTIATFVAMQMLLMTTFMVASVRR